MPWSIDARFDTPANRDVVAYIRQHPTLSAHDDVVSVLIQSAQELPDAQRFCPNVHAYAYFVLHTARHRIFAMAMGQRGLLYRLPTDQVGEATVEGGRLFAELGADWVMFDAWRSTPPVDAAVWCKRAHDAAPAEH